MEDEEDSSELLSIPYVPESPTPTPILPEPSELSEPDRQRAIKRSRLRLQQATDEVERLRPTGEKLLAGVGLNLRESAAGSAKQAVGNVIRSYTDIVAPKTPHQPGTFQYYLQFALKPTVAGMLLSSGDAEDPLSAANIARMTGQLTAGEGTTQLREAQELTQQLGGGPLVSGASSLASTAGASAPALLAAPLGLTPAAIAAGLQSYGQNIEGFKEKLMQRDPKLTEQAAFDQAMLPAAITGAATAALTRGFGGTERLIEQITTKGLSQGGVKAALRDVFKSATLEFPEEYLDQLSQGFTEKAFVDPNKDVGAIFDEAAMAGLQGFALGGITGGAVQGVAQTGSAVASRIRREGDTRERKDETPSRVPAQQGQPAQTQPAVEAPPGAAQRPGPSGQAITTPKVADAVGQRFTRSDGIKAIVTRGTTGGPQRPYRITFMRGDTPIDHQDFAGEESVQEYLKTGAYPGEWTGAKTTTDIVQEAVDKVVPPPAPPKRAVFGGYQFGDNPTFKIPGIRPGWFRDVSAERAQQLGYELPPVPTRQEWEAAGRPLPTPQVSEERARDIIEAASPAPTKVPIQIQKPDGTIENAEFTGYFDYRDMGRGAIPSIGYKLADGRVSHGFLKAGDKIITPVPSFEEWSQAGAASPSDTAFFQREAPAVNWREFATADKSGYTVIDTKKLKDQLLTGKLKGQGATNQLLLHLLKDSSLHPLNSIQVINATPTEHTPPPGSSYAGKPYRGLFYTRKDSNVGTIEVLLKNRDGTPVTQETFVEVLAHELVHNNIGSKLADAPAALQQEANDIFNFVLQNSAQTTWTGRNALSNVNEFFSEAMTDPEFQEYLSNLDYGTTGKANVRRSVFSVIMDFVKRLLKLPDFMTIGGTKVPTVTVLEQVFSTSSQLEQVQRKSANARSAASPSSDPNITEAQIQGGAAEVGRIADAIYATREQGVAALEGLAYEKNQFKTAAREIKRLNDLAIAGYIQQELDPENVAFPDATAGVGINEDGIISADSSFTDALDVVGVPHNPANVQHLQEELFYERAASRYNKLVLQSQELTSAINHYQQLGVDPEEIARINKQIAALEDQIQKLGAAELDGRPVTERAGEMTEAENLRQERIAQRNALALEPVADFFGRQVGGYREFSQKAQQALDMALATKNAATDPEALRLATLASEQWLRLPADIRNSILTGRPLTTEQKSAIFSALGQVFEEFDFAQSRMREQLESRIPELNKDIRDTLGRIADAKIQTGMGEVLISDVLSTLDGETGATGNLKSLKETQALRERVAAIESFAMALGSDLQNNQALFNWLANPSTPKPIIPPGITMGADPATVQMILNEVQRNPAFGSSVLTLINAANKKLANMPITGLQQIEELIQQGTPEAQNQAEDIARSLRRKGRAQVSLGAANLRESLNQLDAMEIERRSLQEGVAMFEQLAASPEFRATRDAVQNSPFGLVEPMVPQNHVATTFKAFGGPGLPSHPELVLGADRDVNFKADWFKKVAEWHRKAQEYVDGYDVAAALHAADPVNNPPPQQLGYDIPKVRGLRDATQRFVPGAFLELSLNSEGGRWKVPWLARALSRTSLFRQHDFVAKMVGGVTGTDLRARLGDFVNHYLTAQGIRDDFKDIPDKLHKALRSHPEFGMNIANYREFWNEMAHWGRMFGSPVKAGMVLPRSGRTITNEDIALLTRERAYEEQLRRRVTETNVTQGVRIKTPGRELVRPGAFVGDEGLPRFPGRRADGFIADALAAYNIAPPAGSPPGTPPTVRTFGPTTDFGPTSADPVVSFWNRNIEHLIQHILDSRRTDRQMVLGPAMGNAERDLAAQWILNGKPSIGSMEELINLLVGTYPTSSNPDLNPREEVIKGLNAELRQYRDAAQRIATDRAERDQARQSKPEIAFSADNEFTRPAAKLELPSALYDYGALSPGEHLSLTSRANHERIVAYATAVERAISELENRYKRYEAGEIDKKTAASSYGGDIKEMRDVINILKKVQADFRNAYASGSFTTAPRGLINDTLGLFTSAILALPTVGIRNMTQGQFEVYAMSRAMGTAGHWMTAANALKAIPRTLVRFALHAGDGAVRRTNLGMALLTGKNRHLFENTIRDFGNMITGEDFRAVADKIGELGMDGRDSFLQRLQRIWQETSEFVSREDMETSWTLGGRKVRSTAAIPAKVARAFFDKIGVQQYDFAINTAALNNADLLAQRLKQVADVYGKARDGLGQFDPTNRAFDLKPAEWSTGADAADTLAQTRQVLETGLGAEGFQLERALWEFYQKKKANVPNPRMLNDRQMEALQRRILADMNASTPANRPSAASANGIVRNLLLLQGYPSDLMLKLINHGWGTSRDRGELANSIVKAPAIGMLALMAILIGYLTSSATGAYEKYLRGRVPALATPLDKDFWNNWKRFAEGTLALGAAQFGYLGDIILSIMGEVRGNRGFDPTGRILGVSLITRALTALRGAKNTARAGGTLGDTLVPMADVARSMVPFWLETERLLGAAQGSVKQAERVLRGEAQTQGMMEGRSGFQPPTYGPTTVFRRNLGDAVSQLYEAQQSGNQAGAAAALADAKAQIAKLEEYHYQKYLTAKKDPATARQMAQRDVWNDYQDVNPAVAALLGRRPTQDQYNLLRQGTTGDRGAIVDTGIKAWQGGAQALFGRPGTITREETGMARAGGGGRGFNLPGERRVAFPSFPGTGTRRRVEPDLEPPPVRSVRSRVRRVAEEPIERVRAGTRSVRRLGRQTRFGIRPPRIRQPSVPGRRSRLRRRVGSRRRRDYAAA